MKRGDLLVEFDRQSQLRDFVDKKAQSDDQNGKVLEAQAAEGAARSKDETDFETAESALSKAQLEMEKVELMSRIDAEKAREDLDEAKATLEQLKETFDLKHKRLKRPFAPWRFSATAHGKPCCMRKTTQP